MSGQIRIVEYISEWGSNNQISTSAKLNIETGEVFDIEQVEHDDEIMDIHIGDHIIDNNEHYDILTNNNDFEYSVDLGELLYKLSVEARVNTKEISLI